MGRSAGSPRTEFPRSGGFNIDICVCKAVGRDVGCGIGKVISRDVDRGVSRGVGRCVDKCGSLVEEFDIYLSEGIGRIDI